MRILFVYKMPSFNIRDPLGLLYIISIAKKEGHDCLLLIYDLEKHFFKKALQFKPDLVCYSMTTGSEHYYLDINTILKKHHNFISIFGGPHTTFYPQFIEKKGVDIICRGEAELSFRELLLKLEKREDIHNIPNYWFKRNGHIFKNELQPLIEDLDTVPFPDRVIMNSYFNYRQFGRINIITGRGCPFDCSYCFNSRMREYYCGKGTYVRRRSVDNVISEIKECIDRYGIKELYFVDDIFVLEKNWLAEFCRKYQKKIRLPYLCHIRAGLVAEETVKQLSESGCFCVWIGIESGNQRLRKQILNRDISNEQIYQTCILFKKYKIKVVTFNMVGLPYETIDNAFETIRLNIRCRPSYAWVSILQPYPGTKIYEFAAKSNLLEENYSIESEYHRSSPFKLKDRDQLVNLHNFFTLTIHFPFLIPIVKFIIRWPKNEFFRIVYNGYKVFDYIRTGEMKMKYSYIAYVTKFYYIKVWHSMWGAGIKD